MEIATYRSYHLFALIVPHHDATIFYSKGTKYSMSGSPSSMYQRILYIKLVTGPFSLPALI